MATETLRERDRDFLALVEPPGTTRQTLHIPRFIIRLNGAKAISFSTCESQTGIRAQLGEYIGLANQNTVYRFEDLQIFRAQF